MNRIDRLFAILLTLQHKRRVRAQDLADQFEVSKRTIYRDLSALNQMGIPLAALPGEGFELVEGYYKQGNKDVLAVLGFDAQPRVSVSEIQLAKRVVKIGGDLNFSFEISSTSNDVQNLVIDYVIHHVKANGKRTPKVFKLANKKLEPGRSLQIAKKHPFRLITTREYYPGTHLLEIQVNGEAHQGVEFELK